LLRAVAAVAVEGKLYTPHFLKRVQPVREPGDDHYRPAKDYGNALAGVISVAPEYRKAVVEAMWSVVNEAGTATAIQEAAYDIAGKTGTAQVVGLGKDVGKNKDHSWFVSYAPAFKPEIALLALIENSGFGSRHAAPAVRAVYDVYFEKTSREEEVPDHIARNPR
jgi:penicillin-binding protein 2